uniref:4Fe-4S ferredoxin-type domain-containing protein n=1 Tax=Desulfobacca acetoxidans TaxID=60893 RepID=A0A7C5AM65_9BACT
MYRIRMHGRGGQGIKTAGRLLGSAFFLAGFEVQDAPRYGAERRGAPIFAYVRASRNPIRERGVIRRPDLVIVADDTLLSTMAGEVLAGASSHTVLFLKSRQSPQVWKERLKFPGQVLVLPLSPESFALEPKLRGTALVGGAARLTGVIPREALVQAARMELAPLGQTIFEENLQAALWAYEALGAYEGWVTEAPEPQAKFYEKPHWIDLPLDEGARAAPDIFAPATSELVPTGLWRTWRPVLDREQCRRCVWICSTLCPDSVIKANAEGYPEIDYQHCKGCLICLTSCPAHAIRAVPEEETQALP